MTDKKSPLPSLNELGGMANKFFTDIKKSVTEIYSDYSKKRAEDNPTPTAKEAEPAKAAAPEKPADATATPNKPVENKPAHDEATGSKSANTDQL